MSFTIKQEGANVNLKDAIMEYHQTAQVHLIRNGASEDEAMDIVQDAVLKILEADVRVDKEFDTLGKFRSYFSSAVSTTYIDLKRKEQRYPTFNETKLGKNSDDDGLKFTMATIMDEDGDFLENEHNALVEEFQKKSLNQVRRISMAYNTLLSL